MQDLRTWQNEALNKWQQNNFRGTISAPTGTGKTIFGIAGIKLLHKIRPFDRTLIVVPTIHLQEQWKEELIKAGCPAESIGLCGNGSYDIKRYTVAIFNTARDKPIPASLLVVDECHHINSNENSKILKNNYSAILGLSATPEREDGNNTFFSYAPIVYKYEGNEALINKHLAGFTAYNVAVSLTPEEQSKLQGVNSIVKSLYPAFGTFNAVQQALKRYNPDAVKLMRAISDRKQILQNAVNKPARAVQLIKKELDNKSKIILFSEFIDTAEKVKSLLNEQNIITGIYHSKMSKAEKKKLLNEFKLGTIKVMLAVRALDEGVNVPDANVGIVIAGSSVKRQTIQRLGRILRPSIDKQARYYQLYVPDSKDEDWLQKRNMIINEMADEIKFIGVTE